LTAKPQLFVDLGRTIFVVNLPRSLFLDSLFVDSLFVEPFGRLADRRSAALRDLAI